MTECPPNRGAALALHFAEEDAADARRARAQSNLAPAACRAYQAELAALQASLEAWTDEPPAGGPARACAGSRFGTARQAPRPCRRPRAGPVPSAARHGGAGDGDEVVAVQLAGVADAAPAT